MKFSHALLLAALSCCALPPAVYGQAAALSNADKAVLNAPVGKWTYVSFPDTTCRDGSPSGLAVRRSATSNRVLIFLEGGGICFDAQTCFADNPANTSYQREERLNGLGGLFNFTNPANPVRDWNFVYVPYCSGDLHAGDRKNVVVSGVGTQQFQGRKNLQRFLTPITKLVKKASDVVLTGSSAGGFGATLSFVPVQNAFGDVKVRLIDDSGPFLDTHSLPACLQRLWRTTFGWEKTFLADCGQNCPSNQNYFQDYATWLAKKYSDRPTGLLSYTADYVISSFYGIGLNDCTGVLWEDAIPAATFTQSLLSFRKAVKPYNYSTYFPAGEGHTFLQDDGFYGANVGGKTLLEWFTRVANGKSGGSL